jgi:hypothetical protein
MQSPVNSTSLADIQSTRYAVNLLANSGNSGTRQSPLGDLPGPSGIGPMQNAPLVRFIYFLKKRKKPLQNLKKIFL